MTLYLTAGWIDENASKDKKKITKFLFNELKIHIKILSLRSLLAFLPELFWYFARVRVPTNNRQKM